MAARPSWEGHLRLSLVTCPVALWPATSEADTVRFNMINPKTNNRIRMQTIDAGTGEEISRGDLGQGFHVAKGGFVLVLPALREEVRGGDEVALPDLPKPDPKMPRSPRRSSSSSPATSIPASFA